MRRAEMDEGGALVGHVRLDSPAGRGVIAATVAGGSVTMLTGSAVFVALPSIADDLDASSSQQQWIVNAFLLIVSSLILVGGTLGDRYGRVRMYRIGIGWVGTVSIALSFAPNIETLIAGRLVEATGAALVIPGSLSILEATLHPDDRGRGIGLWAGLVGLAAAIGPLSGGLLLEVSWRTVFLLNVPSVIIALLASRGVPESSNPSARDSPIDWLGAALSIVILGGLSFALIEGSNSGLVGLPGVLAILAIVAVVALVRFEPGHPGAIVPLDLFGHRTFTAANAITFLLYGAIGAVFFLVPTQLQVTLGFSAFEASLVFVPLTILMLAFSASAGDFAQKHGPRGPLVIGSIVIAASLFGFSLIGPGRSSLLFVLLVATVFGAGLAAVVAPITSTALAVPEARAGAASGFNNAISRTAQLLSVASIPTVAGLTGNALSIPEQLNDGYRTAMLIVAVIVLVTAGVAGALLSSQSTPAGVEAPRHHRACAIDGAVPQRLREPERAS